MDDVEIEGGIDEAEKYANLYTPDKTHEFVNKVEAFATTELPPAFIHAGLDFVSPLADNVLEKIRNRVGSNASSVNFVDLQQVISNELTDLEDQQSQFTGRAYNQCAEMIKRFKFIEESVLKQITNEELDTYDKKAINWYLSHNIDRWNRKKQTGDENRNEIAAQNGSYFALLYETFDKQPLDASNNDTIENKQTIVTESQLEDNH